MKRKVVMSVIAMSMICLGQNAFANLPLLAALACSEQPPLPLERCDPEAKNQGPCVENYFTSGALDFSQTYDGQEAYGYPKFGDLTWSATFVIPVDGEIEIYQFEDIPVNLLNPNEVSYANRDASPQVQDSNLDNYARMQRTARLLSQPIRSKSNDDTQTMGFTLLIPSTGQTWYGEFESSKNPRFVENNGDCAAAPCYLQ